MANVFISYARRDREKVLALAAALEAQGLSVWWDPNLVPGRKFRHMIAEQLGAADSVVVVWTSASLESDWVQDEAEEARQRGVLVPVKMEPVQPPAGFRQVQSADLSQWTGNPEHPEFRLLVHAVTVLADQARAAGPAPQPPGAILPTPPAEEVPPSAAATAAAPPKPDPPWERPGDFLFDAFSRAPVWLALTVLTLIAGAFSEMAVGGMAAVFVAISGWLAGAARRAGVGGLTKNLAIGGSVPLAVLTQCAILKPMGFALAMMTGGTVMFTAVLIGLLVHGMTRRASERPSPRQI